jgi:undecaprenyl-diphosphatase
MKKASTRKPIDKPQNAVVESAKKNTSTPGAQRRKALIFQVSFGILLLSFGVLTFLIVTVPAFSIDLTITRWLQSITNPGFAGLMTYISWVGYGPQSFIISAIIVVLLCVFGYYWEGTSSLVISVVIPILNYVAKILVHRARPSADLVIIVNQISGYSFPSGHVMFYTGFFGFICFLIYTLLKPSWIRNSLFIVFGSLILLVGISRIYLGNHWATDVLGAYLLGGACLMVSISLYRWGKKRFFLNQPSARVKPNNP